jgi:two-component system cell cycle response regulator
MRKAKTQRLSGHTILLVDDNAEYLEATRLLLEHEGHTVVCAANGEDALAVLRLQQIDLMLLDFYMPGITGEEVETRLRHFSPYVQVILQTGYASEQPPRALLRRLDIQGYYDKSDGPEKLLMWTDAGLKSAYTIQMLNKSRQGLRYILDTTPDLHKIQPLDDLLQGILYQIAGLLGAVNSFLAVLPEGGVMSSAPAQIDSFVATMEDDRELIIRAGTGRFSGHRELDGLLEDERVHLIMNTLKQAQIQILDEVTIVPLRVGEATLGVIYLDLPAVRMDDIELLHIFANQAAVAIQNMQLYAMATLDALTGTFARGFFDKWLLRELRTALRSQHPLTLLMVDIDVMKKINDTAGHLAGDQALVTVGKALRQATRMTDIVARYGGDEFAIVLPQSEKEGADVVTKRILHLLEDKSVPAPTGPLHLSASLGLSTLRSPAFAQEELPRPISQTYFQRMGQELIKNADEALYQAKKDEENRIHYGEQTEWLPASAMEQTDADGQ